MALARLRPDYLRPAGVGFFDNPASRLWRKRSGSACRTTANRDLACDAVSHWFLDCARKVQVIQALDLDVACLVVDWMRHPIVRALASGWESKSGNRLYLAELLRRTQGFRA